MDSRLDARKKDFKKSFDDPRRKREDAQVQIRKSNREAQLFKRRQEVSDSVLVVAPDGKAIGLKDLPILAEAIMSNDPVAQFEATQHFRRLLSIAQDPPIQAVIECNVVPKIVEFLDYHHNPGLQFEAAWSLTNIASGSAEQTKIVVDSQAIPKLVSLLLSPKRDVVEQAIWTLGNIAGDSPQCRDLVLQAGCLQALMKVLEVTGDPTQLSLGVLRYGTWALSNLCRGKPEPAASAVLPALPTIRNLLFLQDSEVLQDACWALSYISDGSDPRCIQELIQSGVCPRLVSLLDHKALSVLTPALRAVGNIVTGNDEQTQAIIVAGGLPYLNNLLSHSKKAIRKEACWTISNITAGNREQIQAVIDANIISSLLHILTTADFEVKREAAWAISNAASGGNISQVEYMLSCGCFQPLSDLLEVQDMKVVIIALEAIENILKTGREKQQMEGTSTNPYVGALEMAGAFPKLEQLQSAPEASKMFQITWRIMTEYLDAEVDVSDQEAARQAAESSFNFGTMGLDNNNNKESNFNF